MARYLMTHSLMSSWLYAMKENPFEDTTREEAQADLDQLARKKGWRVWNG